jgi:hypothetical protein
MYDESTKRKVYYQLTKEAAIPDISDHCIGCWFEAVIIWSSHENRYVHYTYPYILQENGGWLMCARPVYDLSTVELHDSLPIN